MSTDRSNPTLLDIIHSTFQAERAGLESSLLRTIQTKFDNAELDIKKMMSDIAKEEFAKAEGTGAFSGGGQGGLKGTDAGTELRMDGETVEEDIGITAINSTLNIFSTRLAVLEAQILSVIEKDQEFKKALDRRFRSLEGMMNAILSGTAQGKRFLAEHFELDPTKYQEAMRDDANLKEEEVSRLAERWRHMSEMQKKELEGDEKRRLNLLTRLGRATAQAEQEYVEAMLGERWKVNYGPWSGDSLCDEAPREQDRHSSQDAGGYAAQEQYRTEWQGEENMNGEGYTSGANRYGQGDGMELDENERGDTEVNEVQAHWQRYERQEHSEDLLTFDHICWPMLVDPQALANWERMDGKRMEEALKEFLLSPLHSQELTPRQRIKNALLRWHPDKGMRLLHRLQSDEERRAAMAMITDVAACLMSIREQIILLP